MSPAPLRRPGPRLAFPSYFWATSSQYQRSNVSGVTVVESSRSRRGFPAGRLVGSRTRADRGLPARVVFVPDATPLSGPTLGGRLAIAQELRLVPPVVDQRRAAEDLRIAESDQRLLLLVVHAGPDDETNEQSS